MTKSKTKVFFKETTYNYIYQFTFITINFILVPMLINYLGEVKYGAWILLLSIISWMNIANFGLGNGLRNKVAENFNLNDNSIVTEYVSTTLYTISMITAAMLFIVGTPLLFLDDLSWLIHDQTVEMTHQIKLSLLIIFLGFCINLILGIYKSIAYGIQKSSWTGESNAVNALLLLLFISILLKFFDTQLTYVALVYVMASILSNALVVIRVLRFDRIFLPKLSAIKNDRLKDILNIGIGFFIIQICMIIVFSTDNILITKLFGLEYVTEYTIIDKIFTMGNTLFSILLIALWSSITKAYAENNFKWMKEIIQKLHLFFFAFLIGTTIVGIYLNDIVGLWIGKTMNYSYEIIVIFVIYTLLSAYGGIFVNIVNGLGKIKLQIYLMVFAAIINIPLSILLGQYFGLGIKGIKLGTLCSLLLLWILIPLQVYRIIYTHKKVDGK